MGLDRDLDLLRVQDKTYDSLVRGGTVLSDLVVEPVRLLDPVRRLLH